MNPNQYIISKLESFIKDFPQMRVRYEYDEGSDTHFVEVIPNEVYYMDSNYKKWEGQMFDDFVEQFPYEGICFISDDAIVGLENVDFEIYGEFFEVLYTTSEDSISVCEGILEITNSITSYSLDMNERFSQMNKEVHVENTSDYSHNQPDNSFLLAA